MLDSDLAVLYQVETKVLNQAVKRNNERFPVNFMFQLSSQEFDNLRSQFVTSSWGGVRYLPHAFTVQGIYMLMTVLKGDLATKRNNERFPEDMIFQLTKEEFGNLRSQNANTIMQTNG